MKHIKTPVRVGSYMDFDGAPLLDADYEPIGRLYGSHNEPMFAEIASALNAHDALVEVCRAALSFINEDADAYPPPYGYTTGEMKAALRAALALVKEGE